MYIQRFSPSVRQDGRAFCFAKKLWAKPKKRCLQMNQKKDSATRVLVECAVLVAIASVLCVVPKFKFLAYGGSVTVCSALPVILVSYRRGLKWGFLSALAFALIQLLTGLDGVAGLSLSVTALAVLLDYLLAFTVLGVGGALRGKLKSPALELSLGSLLALFLRFAFHVLSGYVVWGQFADNTFGGGIISSLDGSRLALAYSLLYNASYMLPEMVITAVVAAIISPLALRGLSNGEAARA
jgi:thiamine transporter